MPDPFATPRVASTAEVRSHFPALERRHDGQPVAYFDGPGGTQVPRPVVAAMAITTACHLRLSSGVGASSAATSGNRQNGHVASLAFT